MRSLLSFLILLAFGCTSVVAGEAAKYLNDEEKALEAFSRAFALIRSQAVPKKTTGELTEAAITGMLQSLDPYSELYSRSQYERLQSESLGKYIGIGVQLLPRPEGLKIATVTAGSPAQKAGLQRGDLFKKLNGKLIHRDNEQEIFETIPRRVGQAITVTTERAGKEQKFNLKFATISHPSVTLRYLSEGVFLITISDFQKNTAQEISAGLKGKKLKAIVLDLRNNPGGLLLSAIETAELFIKEGLILEVKDQSGKSTQRYLSQGFSTLPKVKTAVLINGRTASSAEILAGAIKDLNQGKTFGEKTFGKGSIQSIFALNEELFAKVTIAKYYTAGGKSFHKVGIKPDVVVKDHLTGKQYDKEDKIFIQALAWVKSR